MHLAPPGAGREEGCFEQLKNLKERELAAEFLSPMGWVSQRDTQSFGLIAAEICLSGSSARLPLAQ